MAHTFTLSPELALLACCDLASDEVLAQRAAQAARSGIDWGRFEILARRHGMAAMAGDRLSRAAQGTLPAELARSFHRILLQDTALQLAHSTESAKLTARLGEAGIRSIVLKGAAVAHMLYKDNPHWRSASDIDILVDPQRFLDADCLLRSAGYARSWPEGELPDAGFDMFLHLANVFDYRSPATHRLVEMHCRPRLNPYSMPESFDELFASTIEIETEHGPIRGLEGPLLVSYLCWHALGHAGYRLKWFGDIARALRRASTANCLEYLAQGASRHSLHPAAVTGSILHTLANAAGVEWPDCGATSRMRETRRVIHDMEHVSPLPTSRSLARLPDEFADLLFVVRLARGWQAKAYHWLRTFSDPRDVFVLRRGRTYAALYAAAGPLLAVWRFLRRSRPLRTSPSRPRVP